MVELSNQIAKVDNQVGLFGYETRLFQNETCLFGNETRLFQYETCLFGYQTRLFEYENRFNIPRNTAL